MCVYVCVCVSSVHARNNCCDRNILSFTRMSTARINTQQTPADDAVSLL